MDLEGDGNFLKTWIDKGEKKQWERPSEKDEIDISYSVKQGEKVFEEKSHWRGTMDDPSITVTWTKLIESMKAREKSSIQV